MLELLVEVISIGEEVVEVVLEVVSATGVEEVEL